MSYANLNAHRVANACREYLAAREQRIALVREALIDAEMQRRFFAPKTRDAAKARLVSAGKFGEYEMAGVRGGYWADRIKDLLHLAIAAGPGHVSVCAEEAAIIANFLTPNAS